MFKNNLFLVFILCISWKTKFVLSGCSDGSDDVVYVAGKIVGCDGQFSNGLFSLEAQALCSPGWHICSTPQEARGLGLTSSICSSRTPSGNLYASASRSSGSGICTTTGDNDAFGCGDPNVSWQKVPDQGSCSPFNARTQNLLSTSGGSTWSCSGCAINGENELVTMKKTGLANGGVLCCSSGPLVSGDPIVRTLDGITYEFQSLCSYILLMDCNDNFSIKHKSDFNKFQIIGSNKPCDLGTCLSSLVVFLKDSSSDAIRVDLLPGLKTKVNGTTVNIDESSSHKFGYKKSFKLSHVNKPYSFSQLQDSFMEASLISQYITDNITEDRVRLDTKFGLSIEWNGADRVLFDTKHMNSIKTCGLLGHKDGNSDNDMRFPDGSKLDASVSDSSITSLDLSWIVQTFVHRWTFKQHYDPRVCKVSTPRKLCDGDKSRKLLASNICDGLISAVKCISKDNDIDVMKQKCVHDMCFCYNDDIFSCGRYLYHSLLDRCNH